MPRTPPRHGPATGLRRVAPWLGAFLGCATSITVLAHGGVAAAQSGPRLVSRDVAVAPAGVVPSGARRVGAVPAGETLRFDIALNPSDPGALASLANAVTTPGSPNYRDFLTPARFAARFGSPPAVVGALSATLRRDGLSVLREDANRLALHVSGSAGRIERALGTMLVRYRSDGGADFIANTAPVHLPAALAAHVAAILGLDTFAPTGPTDLVSMHGAPEAPRASAAVTPHVGVTPTPACSVAIAAAYGNAGAGFSADQVAGAYGLAGLYGAGDLGAGTTIGVIEFSPFNASDIGAYANCYGITPSVNVVPVDGGPSAPAAANEVEAELDIEILVGLAPAANVLVYEGPNGSGSVTNAAAYDTYAAAVDADQAQVITTSWGSCEPAMGSAAIKAEAALFEQAALQGQSVIAAAGDSGAEDCLGTLRGAQADARAVDDPSSQPFVTGVGGTFLSLAPTRSEVAWNTGSSAPSPGAGGGGVSRQWAMPRYQLHTVPGDALLTTSACATRNRHCREVPDLSSDAGAPFAIYCTLGASLCGRGGWTSLGGTSASAPTVAAIVALADANSACATTAPLGFLNPALYLIGTGVNAAEALTGITSGNNDLTGTNSGDYAAGPGYNLATGLGSPITGNGADGGLVAQLCSPVVEAAAEALSGLPRPNITGVSPSTVRTGGGHRVVLTGTGFTGASRVIFGATPAKRFRVVSATKIVAFTPAAVGHLHVTVTTRDGTTKRTPADVVFFSRHR